MGGAISFAIGRTPEEAEERADQLVDQAADLGLTDVRMRSKPKEICELKEPPEWFPTVPIVPEFDWVVFLWIHS